MNKIKEEIENLKKMKEMSQEIHDLSIGLKELKKLHTKEIEKLKNEKRILYVFVRKFKDERAKAEKEIAIMQKKIQKLILTKHKTIAYYDDERKAMIEKIENVLDHTLTDNQGTEVRKLLEKLKGDGVKSYKAGTKWKDIISVVPESKKITKEKE